MTEEINNETYLTPAELAKRWHMKASTLSDWRRLKRGPSYFQPGGKYGDVLYSMNIIKEYEKRNTFTHTGGAENGNLHN